MNFINELRRRNVFKVSVAYVIISWLLAQIADLMLENFGAPDWVIKSFLGFLIIGFPLALFFAWAFELTPDGVKRESEVDRSQSITTQTGHKLNFTIVGIMAVALAWFAWDKFGSPTVVGEPLEVAQVTKTETAGEQTGAAKSIAVLPFVAMSSGPDDGYFADGLTEEILNSLSQLPELLVTARTSAFHFKGQDVQIPEIARALGVNHVVEGSVRRSGDRLRVTAQLIRAKDGFHLWSENYDSTSKDTIAVQEDIAEKIADAMDVVMNDEKREAMRQAGLRDVEAFIAYQKGLDVYGKAHGEVDQIAGLQKANEYFEAVLERVADFAPAYVLHSDVYFHILLADATNDPMPSVSDSMKVEAFQYAEQDLTASSQYSRSPAERHNAELDLAFLNGNWRGIKGRIEQVLDDQGCAESNWLTPLVAVFDYAQKSLARQREFRTCDPLVSTTWFNETRMLLWALDAPAALDIVRQGDQVAPGNWLNQALIKALVANGKFDEADDVIANRLQDGDTATLYSLMVAAARGDSGEVPGLLDEAQNETLGAGFFQILIHAWAGDLETANRVAAQIDQHPAGPLALTLLTYWCACGAPWEISNTPVYAATIKEAGLPWPPVSPIKFPLKDW